MGRSFLIGVIGLISVKLFIYLFIYFAKIIPACIIYGPPALACKYLSEKERVKALSASKVKILGNDVVASYRILTSLVYIFYLKLFIYHIKRLFFHCTLGCFPLFIFLRLLGSSHQIVLSMHFCTHPYSFGYGQPTSIVIYIIKNKK